MNNLLLKIIYILGKKKNIIDFINIIYFVISLFLIGFVSSRLVRDYQFKGEYYSNLLIASIFLTLTLFLIFFLKKNIRELIIIVITATLVGIYSAEIYIHYKHFQTFKKVSNSKFETFKDLKNKNSSIAFSGPISNEPFYSMGGLSNSITILCNETGKWALYKSDRYGFNNPDSEWDKNRFDYLIIGDSFAHGGCVDEGKDITSHIRELSQETAINLGFIGNGPLKNLATLKEYINYLKPKKIYWLHYEGNDLYNLKQEMENETLVKYLKDNFTLDLINKQNMIDIGIQKQIKIYEKYYEEWNDFTVFKFDKYKFYEILKLSELRKIFGLSAYWNAKVDSNFEIIMEKAKKEIDFIDADLYFVYLPSYVRFNQLIVKDNFFDKNNLFQVINKLDIKIIDLEKLLFNKSANPLKYFPNRKYGHYTSEAYKKIAEILISFK